jgi:hypothetical protein
MGQFSSGFDLREDWICLYGRSLGVDWLSVVCWFVEEKRD